MRQKPNLFELETLRIELIEKLNNTSSNSFKVFLFYNYFDKVLSANNNNFIEAFLKEFIDDYIHSISKFEVFGANPEFSNKLITQLNTLSSFSLSDDEQSTLELELKLELNIEILKARLEKLKQILAGKETEDGLSNKAFFPLIDKEAPDEIYGVIDSITVRISKSADNDRFIIIPSETEIEKRIEEQVKRCWQLALMLAENYIKKPYKYHEVILSFDKKLGFYEGNSLGIALTLSFLEQLLKFYNPVYIINIKEYCAFTGGVDNDGKVLVTGEEIIKQKVKAIFFSEINSFVIPKSEETYAYFALAQLKKYYPNRNLKLIPVEDINDVINRRDLVDIKKQKLVVRTGKFVKKNWISAFATVLLAVLFAFLFVMDFDNNPSYVTVDGKKIYIKNEKGRTLFSKYLAIDERIINNSAHLKRFVQIIKTDLYNYNCVIICGELDKNTGFVKDNSIVKCYDYMGKILWNYNFKDRIILERDTISDFYINLIDTITFIGQKSILLSASSMTNAPSSIFRININDGIRLPGTFWAWGHIMDCIIKDYDKDLKPEILGVGYDNGYEDLTFFSFEMDTLTKVRPTIENYLTRAFPKADMETYIRFPKTDFDIYNQLRSPYYMTSSFSDNEKMKKYKFATAVPNNILVVELGYEINYSFNDVDIVVASGFRVQRDSLVVQGKLSLPYTDTNEYVEILKNKILYWKDGKWFNRNGVEKK